MMDSVSLCLFVRFFVKTHGKQGHTKNGYCKQIGAETR